MIDKVDVLWLEKQEKYSFAEVAIDLKERAKESTSRKTETAEDGFSRSAGSWQGLIDSEKLIADVYASREN